MLQPRKRKYRKEFRGTMKGFSQRGNYVAYGEFGLKALDRAWITARQIEAARRAISHHTKRAGKTFIRIFPHKPITDRPAGSRMGSGKGDISQYVAVITPGRVLFELAGVDEATANKALKSAANKLPIKTKIIAR
ncbi:50S ribosomal protein L16 [Candidatus Chazhemtobacterium aquaticus]|uniref:Large ribosomal subunit protein uL16 n=1 Tax=Candidatus Chazhemtobacterium aquaticus TaxID=2715735 RepID=A0A857N4X8_9BACT|nr:50S ribosomal protein L16 [Candidatus Chazhemtobacterium aquaticus]QHO63295.1 LSU ribosomal protein L16p (L10e) [Candidatus Chazhemtobacterium aquaticus]